MVRQNEDPVLPDTNRQEYISGKHNGALGAHCIVRKRAALAGQTQHRFAGFEENLNVLALAV